MNEQKKIVIYASKTGFSRKYAYWISEELECACISLEEAHIKALSHYDIIIFGGGLYAGKLNGLDFVIKNMDVLMEKKLAIFATGAQPNDVQDIETVKKTNLAEYENMPFFYMAGGLCYEKMNMMDKLMMAGLRLALTFVGKKERKQAIKNSYDITARENINELVDFVKENYYQ